MTYEILLWTGLTLIYGVLLLYIMQLRRENARYKQRITQNMVALKQANQALRQRKRQEAQRDIT